jgi:two-component system, NtrC family, sensor kinase
MPAPRGDLAAEAISVKIRWFGLIVGYLLVNLVERSHDDAVALNAILGLGVAYALVDTIYGCRGRVFLARWPLGISSMEAVFIGLLCYYDHGLDSPFRHYYLLSLICCALRYASAVTYATCALHCASYATLFLALPETQQAWAALVLQLVIMAWVTWAADQLALLLKRTRDHLRQLNEELHEHQVMLEERIAERTRELQETQAHVLHQEKMAAFGLLAAGIAHEVGNPLTSISSLVQMVQRRSLDPYTQEKLTLVSGQLHRIQAILHELVHFSRPAATERVRTTVQEIVTEALNIAKYSRGMRSRQIETHLSADLPSVFVIRDQLVQAVLNLLLNALDATDKGGHIEIRAECGTGEVRIEVRDDGDGVTAAAAQKLFQPYFTTKPNGTGLGLFVTRKLVAEHGGQVTCESEPGTTVFRIGLPLEPQHQAPERSAESKEMIEEGAR